MSNPVVIWGVGQLGGVFAWAFLREGRAVIPVRRQDNAQDVAERFPTPERVVVAVGESDLPAVLSAVPMAWRSKLLLVQNELLPVDWERHAIERPTVAVVWFEKKAGTGIKVILPTPVAGPGAGGVVAALVASGIGAVGIDGARLVPALVEKTLYILVANVAGLATGGTVGDLADRHRDLVEEVMDEVLRLQAHRVGVDLAPMSALKAAVYRAFEADPAHVAKGRSAPARLQRALEYAAQANVEVPRLSAIARRLS